MAQRPKIKLPWLNSMRHFFIGGRPNLNRNHGHLPMTDAKVFLYSIEATGTQFHFILWLGWFGLSLWRQWEDFTMMDLRRTSGYSLRWKRRRNLFEGEQIHGREFTRSWWKEITITSSTTKSVSR